MANTIRGSLKRNSVPISGSPTRRKRGRIARACLRCRIGKAKCVYSEGNSKCNKCLARDSECTSLLPGQTFEEAVEDYNLRRKESRDANETAYSHSSSFLPSSYTSVSSDGSTVSPPVTLAEASAAAAAVAAETVVEDVYDQSTPTLSPTGRHHSYTFGATAESLLGKGGVPIPRHTQPIRIPTQNVHRTPPQQDHESCSMVSFKEDIWSPQASLIATPQTIDPEHPQPHNFDLNMHIGVDAMNSRAGSPLQETETQPVLIQYMDSCPRPHQLDIDPLGNIPPVPAHNHRYQMGTPLRVKTQQIDPRQLDTPRRDTPMESQMYLNQVQTPQMETHKGDMPQMQTPLMKTCRVETPQLETPQLETPQMEAPRLEIPRVDPRVLPPAQGLGSHMPPPGLHMDEQTTEPRGMEEPGVPHYMLQIDPRQVYPRMGPWREHSTYYPSMVEANDLSFDYSFAYNKAEELDPSTRMNIFLRQLEMDLQMGPPVRTDNLSEAMTSDYAPNPIPKTYVYSPSYCNESYADLPNDLFDEPPIPAEYGHMR